MKYLITILITFISFTTIAQEVNKTDASGKKQGLWKKYHKTGYLRYEGTFKNDKPIGEFFYYYDTGELQVKMKYKGNSSYAQVVYKSGALKAIGKYVDQKKDSTWLYYDEEGNKTASEYYTKGLKDKIWYVYFKDGKVAEEKEYLNDFENGKWKQYFESGKTKLIATYENGGLEGKAAYFKPNGMRGVSGHFYHGLRDGKWTYYKDDGKTVEKVEIYKKGQRVDANKDDKIIDPKEETPIPEDFLNPDK